MTEKQYGLILPNKNKVNPSLGQRVLNPLRDSDDELQSDDEQEECPLNWIAASLKKSAGNASQQVTQKRLLKEALKEDSSIFQYDEIYDDIKSVERNKEKEKKQKAKPKYINTILQTAEKRKLNHERQKERKVQKEREAEGDEFADKESFVTSSYLKKLEELKKAEEEEQRQRMLEERCDVLKHKNFGAFYSHLYEQKLGVTVKEEPPEEKEESGQGSIERDENKSRNKNRGIENREDGSFAKRETKRKNIRRRSSSSSSSENESSPPSKKSERRSFQIKRERKGSSSDSELESKPSTDAAVSKATDGNADKKAEEETPTEKESRVERIRRLFTKRTVGKAFDDAVGRYFVRVSQREVDAKDL